MAADSALQHILARVQADVTFLESQGVLANDAARQIRGLLVGGPVQELASTPRMPTPSQPAFPSPSIPSSQRSSSINVPALRRAVPQPTPSPTQRSQAKAVWDYAGTDTDELSFRQGDVIEIIDETDADWWTGKLNGREGLFPSNHVEKIATNMRAPPPPPSYVANQTGYSSEKTQYNHPAPSGPTRAVYAPPPPSGPPQGVPAYNPYPPPSSYPGASVYPGASPYPPAAPPAATPPPPAEEKKKKFGGVGGKVRDAAAGGLGFGVGAAVGSSIVNAIL